jgi:hypothetical protein
LSSIFSLSYSQLPYNFAEDQITGPGEDGGGQPDGGGVRLPKDDFILSSDFYNIEKM